MGLVTTVKALGRALLPEKRGSLENPSTSLLTAFVGESTTAGPVVNDRTALHGSAVWAAVTTIASDIASLPFKLYRKTDSGRQEVTDHPLVGVLNCQANPQMTAVALRETLTGHALLRGGGYAIRGYDGAGRTSELVPVAPDRVERRGNVYHVRTSRGVERVPSDMMLHIHGLGSDGLTGWSVVQYAAQSFGLGLAMQEHGARFFSNDARPGGILTHPESLSKEAATTLKRAWQKAHSGQNAHRIALLEEGLTWQAVGITSEEAQFLESRQFQTEEVARWFNIPPHKIGDMSRATFSNVTHQAIQYVQSTLTPWLRRWEQEVDRTLLSKYEREDGLYVEHSVQAMLRGDAPARGEFYRTLLNIGAMTPNEVRARENLPAIEGGDHAWMQLNMAPLDDTRRVKKTMRFIRSADGEVQRVVVE
jgi:HK97 family phage portal protein